MKARGNSYSNALLNPDEYRNPCVFLSLLRSLLMLPSHSPPTSLDESERDSQLEKFIRGKYETRAFSAPATSSLTLRAPAPGPPTRSATSPLPPRAHPSQPSTPARPASSTNSSPESIKHVRFRPATAPIPDLPLAVPSARAPAKGILRPTSAQANGFRSEVGGGGVAPPTVPARPGYAQVQAAFSALPLGGTGSQNFGTANGMANGGMLRPQMTGSAPQNGSAQVSVQQEPRFNPSIWDDIDALAGKASATLAPSFVTQPSYLAPQPQPVQQQQQYSSSFQPSSSPQPPSFQPSSFAPSLPTSTSSFFPAGQSFVPSSQFGQQFAQSSPAQPAIFSTAFPFQPSGTTPFPTQSFQSSPLYPTPGIGTPTGGSQLTNPFHSSMSMAAMGNSATPGGTNPFYNSVPTTNGAPMAQGYYQQPHRQQAQQQQQSQQLESSLWSFAPQQQQQLPQQQQQPIFAGQFAQQQVPTLTGNPYGGGMGGTNPFGAGFGGQQQQQQQQQYGRAWGS